MARTLRAEPSALQIAIRFCPGASRQSIKRLQRAAVPASKLACTSAADPQRRSAETMERQMGKQQKLKAQRRAERKATPAPSLSWQDKEGIHFIAPGVPQPGFQEKLTENFQKQIQNSPLWPQMVTKFGEENARKGDGFIYRGEIEK